MIGFEAFVILDEFDVDYRPSLVWSFLVKVINIQAAFPADQNGFKLERSSDVKGLPGIWAEIGTILSSNQYLTQFVDTNVIQNTTNWYRARAFNALGISAYGDPTSVAVVPPPPPDFLSATPFRSQVNLSWYGNYQVVIDGYELQRAPDAAGSAGSWSTIATTVDTFFSDAGLGLGSYWYRVRARNWIGESSWTAPIRVTVEPPDAPAISASVG